MRTALVIGSASGVYSEVKVARSQVRIDAAFAVNDAIGGYPGVLFAAVSLHPEKLPRWLRERTRHRLVGPEQVVTHSGWTSWFQRLGRPQELGLPGAVIIDQFFEGQTESGSSGLLAVKAALVDFHFDRVVLAGVPMDAERAHVGKRNRPWAGCMRHRRGWEQAAPHLQGRVFSMSGWTREQFGGIEEISCAG